MARSFVYDVQISQPVERVWTALTDSAQLGAWLMPNDFRPEVGHAFQFKGAAAGGSDGVVKCKVLEVTPRQRIAYSWAGGPMMDTRLTWELTPEGGGTRVTVKHEGFNLLTWGFVSLFLGSRWKKLDAPYLEALKDHVSKG